MEDTQTQVLGVKSLITANVRERIKSEGLGKAVMMMWHAIERKGIPPGGDLSIVLLAGEDTGVDDYLSGKRELTTKVKEDSQ